MSDKVVSGWTSRTLTNRRSSLTQRPVRNSLATIELVAESLSCFAARSEIGAISSPNISVATAKTIPMRNRVLIARQGASPEVRITVYSELEARCESV